MPLSQSCSRHERRDEDQGQHDEHDERRGPVFALEAAALSAQPSETQSHGPEDDDRPTYGTEEDVDGRDPRVGIDERDGQGQEDPTDDVVAHPGGEDDLPDFGLEEFGLGEDPTENGEGGDGCCVRVDQADAKVVNPGEFGDELRHTSTTWTHRRHRRTTRNDQTRRPRHR